MNTIAMTVIRPGRVYVVTHTHTTCRHRGGGSIHFRICRNLMSKMKKMMLLVLACKAMTKFMQQNSSDSIKN